MQVPESSLEDFLSFIEPTPTPTQTPHPTALQCAEALQAIEGADPGFCQELASQSTPEFIETLLGAMSRRARFVRDQILRHRHVTAWEVKKHYSNETAAVNDLVQVGIPLRTTAVKAENGRSTTQYTFDPQHFRHRRDTRGFVPHRSKVLEGGQCALCPSSVQYWKRTLQIDHRIPFSLVGNAEVERDGLAAVQALCPSHNTAKQHACKACEMFRSRDSSQCRGCYWAYPDQYQHIAGQRERRLTVVAHDGQEPALQQLRSQAVGLGLSVA